MDELLRSEIENDPVGLGYKNDDGTWKSNEDIAGILNVATRSVPRMVPIPEIMAYIHTNGIWIPIEDGSTDASLPKQIRDSARMVMSVMHARYENVDINLPIFGQVLNALVQGNLIQQKHKDEVIALGSRMASRAEELGLPTIEYWDVGRVRPPEPVDPPGPTEEPVDPNPSEEPSGPAEPNDTGTEEPIDPPGPTEPVDPSPEEPEV